MTSLEPQSLIEEVKRLRAETVALKQEFDQCHDDRCAKWKERDQLKARVEKLEKALVEITKLPLWKVQQDMKRGVFRDWKDIARQALAGTAPQPGKEPPTGNAREAAKLWRYKFGPPVPFISGGDPEGTYVINAFLAGVSEGEARGHAKGFRRGLEEAARYVEKTDALGYPVKPANIRSLSSQSSEVSPNGGEAGA